MARRVKGLTLEQIIHEIEDGNVDVTDIYIEPPDPAVQSDEDSASEDEGGTVDNLTGRQLRVQAEGVVQNCLQDNLLQETVEPLDDISVPVPTKKVKKTRRKPLGWTKEDLVCKSLPFPEADLSAYRNVTPVEAFQTFLDDDIVLFLCSEATRYALFKNETDPCITPNEMKVFIGILIVSGYVQVPGKKMFWEKSPDVHNELISNAMRRDRFIQIIKYIHCADNTEMSADDKMWKLRPLIQKVQDNCRTNFKPEQNLAYDECMIPYFGKHGCKQFMKGKPIRFGFKVWCLNTVHGYLVSFDVYQGQNPFANTQNGTDFGKAAAPLVDMIDNLPEDMKGHPFRIYFDNLFTGVNLVSTLHTRGYDCPGTMRENRVPKDCPLLSSKEMKKNKRGTFDYAVCKELGFILVRWVDNAVVTVASSCHGIHPVDNVKRYSQAEKKNVRVPRPALISKYNQYMGGTDRMDENVALYRIGIRGKKWWWAIFTLLIDIMVHNSWILFRKSGRDMKQLNFRREIAKTYLTKFSNAPKSSGRTPTSSGSSIGIKVSNNIRLDGMHHFIAPTTQRRRCAAERCESRVRTECVKCRVGICVTCFAKFHTEP